jgi:hypothetical protein
VTAKRTSNPQEPHRTWPKRLIVDTEHESVGIDPYTKQKVSKIFDVLECGHRKVRRGLFVWEGNEASLREQPNTSRYCEPCAKETP